MYIHYSPEIEERKQKSHADSATNFQSLIQSINDVIAIPIYLPPSIAATQLAPIKKTTRERRWFHLEEPQALNSFTILRNAYIAPPKIRGIIQLVAQTPSQP